MNLEEELKKLNATVQNLKNRQDILDCIQRESRARDRQDAEAIASCWWEDGIDEHGPNVTKAPEYATRANKEHAQFFNMTSHNITNHLCEIQGDTAYCESYVVGGLFWLNGKTTTIAFGRYLDQLERRKDQWRIVTRRCTIEMTADTDATWVYSGAVKGFLKAQWSKADPSYERPIVSKPDGLRW
jgi:ketosteroid isomerase-like protein